MNTPPTTGIGLGSRYVSSAQPRLGQLNPAIQKPLRTENPIHFKGQQPKNSTIEALRVHVRQRPELLWKNIRLAAKTMALSTDSNELAFDPKDVEKGLRVLKSWLPLGSFNKRTILLQQIEEIGVHYPELAAILLAKVANPKCSLEYIGKVIIKFNDAGLNRDDVYTIMDSLDQTEDVSQKTVFTRSHTLRKDNRFYCIVKSPPKMARPAKRMPGGTMEVIHRELVDGQIDIRALQEGDWVFNGTTPISPQKFADDYDLVEYTPDGLEEDPNTHKPFNRKSFTVQDLQRLSADYSETTQLAVIQKIERRPLMIPNKVARFVISRETLKALFDPECLDKPLMPQRLIDNVLITFETNPKEPNWVGLPYYNGYDYLLQNRIADPLDARSLALFKRLHDWDDLVQMRRRIALQHGQEDPAKSEGRNGKDRINPFQVVPPPKREDLEALLEESALAANDVRIELAVNALSGMVPEEAKAFKTQYPNISLEKKALMHMLSHGFQHLQNIGKWGSTDNANNILLPFARYQDNQPIEASLLLLSFSNPSSPSYLKLDTFRSQIPEKYRPKKSAS